MTAIAPAIAPALARAASAVLPALQSAAARTGVDFEALFHTARLESGFNPDAKARTSSASGLFQFIDSTWLDTLARHGPRHGIAPTSRNDALALRRNPDVAALMAAEHMAENAAKIEQRTGRAANRVDLYLAHFLGAGGAARFLGALAENPGQAAADLFAAPARANRAIFYNGDGAARSLAEVQALFARKLGMDASSAPRSTSAGAPTGTPVPPAGTYWPAHLMASGMGTTGQQAHGGAIPSITDGLLSSGNPRLAAQAAYLLLAELGAG